MATDIGGLFTTPEQYQLAQQQAQQAQALQYAQLDPRAQANYGFYRAGQQLGGAIGGALGGEDSQLKLISMRQQLANQLNPNDPESYMRIAEIAAQSGDQQFAIAVSDAGRKAASELALIGQRTREKQGADPFQQIIRSGKYTPESLAKYQVSQNVGDLELIEKAKTEATPAKIQEAERVAAGLGLTKGTPEFEKAVVNHLQRPEKPEPKISVGADREGVALELFNKPYIDLTQTERAAVNKRVETEAVAKAPKMTVDLKDPTAVAKANLDVMGKWEGFLKAGGDVEVANRFKAVQSAVSMANAGNPSADGALLYNIAKMYDPSGAVQEGDKKTVTGNPSIPRRFQLLVQGVLEGGSFTPQQRKELQSMAVEIVKNRENQLNVYRKQYVGKVKTLGGTEEDILNPYQGLIKTPLSEFIMQSPNNNPQYILGGRR
jgi:hypothetical protein